MQPRAVDGREKFSERQQVAFDALAVRRSKDRAEFEKAEKSTGLARPVKPLRTKRTGAVPLRTKRTGAAKAAAASQPKRCGASAFGKAWFDSGALAKKSCLGVGVSQAKSGAQILVLSDYEKDLKCSAASLHCRLHGKILAAPDAKIQKGKLIGKHTKFAKPCQDMVVYASKGVSAKHHQLMKELTNAPCIKLMASEEDMLKACQGTASSPNSASCKLWWLGLRAELAALAARVPSAKVRTASEFVENLGTAVVV